MPGCHKVLAIHFDPPTQANCNHLPMKNRAHNLNTSFYSILSLMSAVLILLSPGAHAAQVIQTLPFYDSFDYTPAGLASASSTV